MKSKEFPMTTIDDLRVLAAEVAERGEWNYLMTPLARAVPALLAALDAANAENAGLREQLDARRELEDAVWDILKARLERENPNFIDAMTLEEFAVFDRWIHMEAEMLPADSADAMAADSAEGAGSE